MNKLLKAKKLIKLGVSKAEVARQLGVSRFTVFNWLNGVYKPRKIKENLNKQTLF